jgi:hypothetical protein
MKIASRVALGAAALAVLSGCVSIKTQSFVDPQYHKAGYETIERPAQAIAAKVDVEFQRNGQALPAVDGELRGHVERTLRATGVFTPSASAEKPVITVKANNIADLAAARAKGFKTGLTFGGAGSMVDDNYEFACTFKSGTAEKTLSYQHAIHTAIGHTNDAPAGLTPTTPADAFGRVVEDVVLNFVKDLQDAGAIPKP